MLFNSEAFLFIFFPITLIVYWFACFKGNKVLILGCLAISSLFFYGYWDWRFTPLLLFSILFNYFLIGIIEAKYGRSRWRLTIFGVVVNLLILMFFKYSNLIINTINNILNSQITWPLLVLPLGISFFTFTQLAFLIDVGKRKSKHTSFLEYFVFVTYFPHAIAGPILNHQQFVPQLQEGRLKICTNDLHIGLSIFAIGLSKKVFIADSFGQIANEFFGQNFSVVAEPSYLDSWIGVFAYTFQLYFDFSGYSDMAVGLSRCFGIAIPNNFNSPYLATNISEFWRRWHISLSEFLLRYLYIPLGGNKVNKAHNYLNILVTMMLGGLWHGANWTFLYWGLLHGLYLLIYKEWELINKKRLKPVKSQVLAWAITFIAVSIAWVPFRASSLDDMLVIFKGLITIREIDSASLHKYLMTLWIESGWVNCVSMMCGIAICFLAPSTNNYFKEGKYLTVPYGPNSLAASIFLGLMLGLAVLKMLNYDPEIFLYFQF